MSRATGETSPRGRAGSVVVAIAAAGMFAVFVSLGVWQLQRLAWKQDLIARVDARIRAPAVAAPGPRDWGRISAPADEYRRVRIQGVFLNDRETLVQAVTEIGPGFWVMTPLRTSDGAVVLVNRGFAPSEAADPKTRRVGQISGPATVTGLLRLSEPHGGFLRANAPGAGRWYSRDVPAMARARGLVRAAPYFIDADATPNIGGWPRGGLTVVHFRNSHLSYALTWFGLALMVVLWGAWPVLERARSRRSGSKTDLATAHGCEP